MSLQTSPVTDPFLPPGAQEDRRHHFSAARMFPIDPREPGRTPHFVREELPQQPKLRCIRLAIFDTDQPADKPMDVVGMTIDRIDDGPNDPCGVGTRSPKYEVLKQLHLRR